MIRPCTPLLLVLVATTRAVCADDPKPSYPSWVYPCPKVTTAPTIDGKLGDSAYRSAPVAGGFIDFHRPSQYVKPPTTFQVAHDGKTLYFALRCEEPEIAVLEQDDPRGRDAVAAIG